MTQNMTQNAELKLIEIQVNDIEECMLPHRKYMTRVTKAPNGVEWLCTTFDYEDGDSVTDYPYGVGETPREACASFDRMWNEGEG